MAGAREIRDKIKSIRSTRKITRAMEMVAVSKMRRAQLRMQAARPYANRIAAVIERMTQGGQLDIEHPFLTVRPEKRVGLIVVSTDRGLCGGLNVNLFRQVMRSLDQYTDRAVDVSLMLFGSKAESFFKRIRSLDIIGCQSKLGDTPSVAEVMAPARMMLDAYRRQEVDSVSVVYNHFTNTMCQTPVIKPLLPIVLKPSEISWDYLYEPAPEPLLEELFTRYIEMQIYHSMVENFACEQAARMVAMKNASENAGDFVSHLQLAYNKARQAAITQELAEIVSGAAAV